MVLGQSSFAPTGPGHRRSSHVRGVGFLAVLLAAGAVGLGCEKAHDLRGPARKAGERIRNDAKFSINGGTLTRGGANGTTAEGVSGTGRYVEDLEVLGTNGRQVTRFTRRIVAEQLTRRSPIDGSPTEETARGVLENETILHELRAGKWNRTLLEGPYPAPAAGTADRWSMPGSKTPTPDQRLTMDQLDPWPSDDPLYPAKPVTAGHTWTVGGAALKRLLGSQHSSVTGSATMTFEGLTEFEGERCARIRISLDAVGKVQFAEGLEGTSALKAEGTTYRSLVSGSDRKCHLVGQMTQSASETVDGARRQFTISGPVVLEMGGSMGGGRPASHNSTPGVPLRLWEVAKNNPGKALLFAWALLMLGRSLERWGKRRR